MDAIVFEFARQDIDDCVNNLVSVLPRLSRGDLHIDEQGCGSADCSADD